MVVVVALVLVVALTVVVVVVALMVMGMAPILGESRAGGDNGQGERGAEKNGHGKIFVLAWGVVCALLAPLPPEASATPGGALDRPAEMAFPA